MTNGFLFGDDIELDEKHIRELLRAEQKIKRKRNGEKITAFYNQDDDDEFSLEAATNTQGTTTEEAGNTSQSQN